MVVCKNKETTGYDIFRAHIIEGTYILRDAWMKFCNTYEEAEKWIEKEDPNNKSVWMIIPAAEGKARYCW